MASPYTDMAPEGLVWVKPARDIGDNYYMPVYYVTDLDDPKDGWVKWLRDAIFSESGIECDLAVHIQVVDSNVHTGWIRIHTKEAYNSLTNVLRATEFFLGYPVLTNLDHGYGGKVMVKEPRTEDISEEVANVPE